GGEVDDAGGLLVERTAREEHSGHLRRIHRAVVGRPAALVRLEYVRRDAAERGLPRHAIAPLESHDEIGRLVEVRPAVELLARVDAPDDSLSGLRIPEGAELLNQLLPERVVLCSWRDGALPLPAPQVHVDLAERERIRARPRPVHIGPERAAPGEIVEIPVPQQAGAG